MSAHRFDSWSTCKLGRMTEFARKERDRARGRFEASGAEDRRRNKTDSYATEMAELHHRRAQDALDEMRAELRRRAFESTIERRKSGSRVPVNREGLWDREAA
jgi:hypothetical protein